MPPRVLLAASTTGYQTRSFWEAAQRQGIELRLATDRCHILEDPWGDLAIPVRFENPDESLPVLAGLDLHGVLAVGDRPARLAARAAQLLGLPFHSVAGVDAAADKHLARERFHQAGLPAPEYYRIGPEENAEDAQFYPCVLKPLSLSASRGVIRANDAAEFREALQRIRRIAPGQPIQTERFIPGHEFALEGIVTRGKLQTLAIFDKPDPLDGPFFEETIYTTPPREPRETQLAMAATVERAAAALGLNHGPIHAEFRVNPGGIFMLEAAARPIGGLCSRALRFPHGKTLEELLLLHAIGKEVPADMAEPGGVMMIPIPRGGIFEGVEGVDDARAVEGIYGLEITAKVGQNLIPLPEGASYLGFIFAAGEAAEQALRQAHARLKFQIATALPVL